MSNIKPEKEAAIRLMAELEKGRISGEKEGWHTLEELRKEFGIGVEITKSSLTG
jgi:hypothetical protein